MSQAELENKLDEAARKLASALQNQDKKIVFAESCTGGKMAAAMTAVPGISAHFCGSAVTYREATKNEWLNISHSAIDKHSAESEHTTIAMAKSVLLQTPEADFSVAITGHLGPGVAEEIDGIVYVVLAKRHSPNPTITSTSHKLSGSNRRERQTEAAAVALIRAHECE
jgi:nicotinamide-nucleotide amidase